MKNDKAQCKDSDYAFSLAFSPKLDDATRMIMDFCNECPIRLQCLSEAVALDAYGIWGGTTRADRTFIRSLHL